jgi:hypothetical protein
MHHKLETIVQSENGREMSKQKRTEIRRVIDCPAEGAQESFYGYLPHLSALISPLIFIFSFHFSFLLLLLALIDWFLSSNKKLVICYTLISISIFLFTFSSSAL